MALSCLIISPSISAQQKETGNSLLWEVTGNGLNSVCPKSQESEL